MRFLLAYEIVIICILYFPPLKGDQDYVWQIYKVGQQEEKYHNRILDLMRNYVEDDRKRTNLLRTERLMFEASPYYEMGYVLSEVIERYKRAVENTKANIEFPSTYPFYAVRKLQLVEFAYYETYHLVQMMHEIIRKYWHVNEFEKFRPSKAKSQRDSAAGPPGPNMKDLIAKIKAQEKQRKKDLEKFNKISKGTNNTVTKKKPYNKYWPIDYGWEIQQDW